MESFLNLKRRHQTFVDAYIRLGVASKAWVETGGGPEDAKQRAFEVLQRDDVQKALAERIEEAIAEAGVTNHRILVELARIAFHDVSRLYGEDGNLLPMSQWPEAERAAVEATEVEEHTATDGKVRTRTKKIRMHDKLAALRMLAQYKKLLAEQLEFPNGIPLPPPVFNLGFRNGGPGIAPGPRDPGAEGS